MREAIKKRVDEKLIEAKSDEIANQLKEVGSLFGWMLKNIKNDMPNMGATVQDGEGFPNKYHLETWKQGLAAYLKPKEDKDGASDAPSGIDIYPDAPPD